ncbi:GNAT family N-acetyltransferase [Parasphingorhabdus pacifica]
MIRRARGDDLPVLRDIERAAGAPFRNLGMDAIADDDPPSIEDLSAFQQAGRAWVFADEHDHPAAYLLVAPVDDYAHVEQVSVHPRRARQRLGRQLIDVADAWAAQHDLVGLTLTTYVEVPWNAPYYERLGFRTMTHGELTGGLRSLRDQEAARGLDAWPRVTMLRLHEPGSRR